MKKILVGGLAASTLAIATLSASAVFAHPGSDSTEFAGKLAERFSLNETDVQGFLDEEQEAKETERAEARESFLQGKVDDGTISQEQKDALTAKQAEMQTAREALKSEDLDRDEVHEKMQALRTEFETWAEDLGISLDNIKPEGKGGPGGRMHSRDMN